MGSGASKASSKASTPRKESPSEAEPVSAVVEPTSEPVSEPIDDISVGNKDYKPVDLLGDELGCPPCPEQIFRPPPIYYDNEYTKPSRIKTKKKT